MAEVFPSKRDAWLSVVLWGCVLLMVVAIATVWLNPGDWKGRWMTTGLMVGAILSTLGMLYGTSYTLEEHHLLARSSPLRWRVPYQVITRVAPSRSLLSGPACLLDRLLISRSDRSIGLVISPAEQDRFLCRLAEKSDRFTLEEGQIHTES